MTNLQTFLYFVFCIIFIITVNCRTGASQIFLNREVFKVTGSWCSVSCESLDTPIQGASVKKISWNKELFLPLLFLRLTFAKGYKNFGVCFNASLALNIRNLSQLCFFTEALLG